MSANQSPPTPIRIPDEWKPEIEAAAAKRKISRHAYLLKAIRRVLDGEKAAKP